MPPPQPPEATFNAAQAQDFLALRWAAAQRENPTIFQSGASDASPAAAAGGQKKAGGGAWGNKGGGPAGQRGSAGAAQPSSTFAANLVKAAGQRRGGATA